VLFAATIEVCCPATIEKNTGPNIFGGCGEKEVSGEKLGKYLKLHVSVFEVT
jgi:hypothetical protein